MTFTTYDDSFSTDRDKVRFRVGDTQQNIGPRPDKRNFSDEEIAFALSEEDSRVNGAIAHLFEILANEWAAYALMDKRDVITRDAKEVAKNYREQAAIWRAKPGGADDAERSQGLISITRGDAWTDNATTDYTPRTRITWWIP